MEIADVRLRLNKHGSDIPLSGVTPLQAVLLHVLHGANNGGSTYGEKMDNIAIKGDVKRTDIEEYRRLSGMYGCFNKKGDKIIKLVWEALGQKAPQKFANIVWKDIQFDGVDVAPANIAGGGAMPTAPATAN